MIRRILVLVGAVLLLFGVPTASVAQSPDGPRLAFIRHGTNILKQEVATIGLRGEALTGLFKTSGNRLSSLGGLTFSADGSKLAFEYSAFLGDKERKEGIYMVSPAGGRPRFAAGTKEGIQPVLSPDGETLAFARVRVVLGKGGRARFLGSSVWFVDANGGQPRRVTPWRHGLVILPSSFSPDGTILALSRRNLSGRRPAVIGLRLADHSTFLIAKGLEEAVFSPDGTQLAAMRVRPRRDVPRRRRRPLFGSDLFVIQADGTAWRQLTFDPSALKGKPSWDPSGERLLYVRFPSKLTLAALFGFGSSVVELNADGTCRHRLIFEPETSYFAAAWQPGPGREAGRISC